MRVETVIGLADQLAVEPFLADSRFVGRREQDRPPPRVEGKREPPLPASRAEPQFLQVRVARVVQGVNPGSPQLRPESLEEPRQRQDLRSYVFMHGVELRLKLVPDFHHPRHSHSMASNTYAVKYIRTPAIPGVIFSLLVLGCYA